MLTLTKVVLPVPPSPTVWWRPQVHAQHEKSKQGHFLEQDTLIRGDRRVPRTSLKVGISVAGADIVVVEGGGKGASVSV